MCHQGQWSRMLKLLNNKWEWVWIHKCPRLSLLRLSISTFRTTQLNRSKSLRTRSKRRNNDKTAYLLQGTITIRPWEERRHLTMSKRAIRFRTNWWANLHLKRRNSNLPKYWCLNRSQRERGHQCLWFRIRNRFHGRNRQRNLYWNSSQIRA